jgi:hypothetical protein
VDRTRQRRQLFLLRQLGLTLPSGNKDEFP